MQSYDVPDDWYRRAVEVVPHGVACVSNENVFLYVNHAYCKLVGYSQAELVGRTWMSITHDDDVGGDLKSVNDLKNGQMERDSYTLEKRYVHRNGSLVHVLLSVFACRLNGEIVYFIACAEEKMGTREYIVAMESSIKHDVEALRKELAAIQAEREFRDHVIAWIRKNWPLIAGVLTMAATVVWHLATLKAK
jgi:PAS domain S-box-containing protein